MEIEKKVSLRTVIGGAILFTFAIFVLDYQIYTLENEKKELQVKDIVNEYNLLNLVRTYEWKKSMVTIDLLKCKGVKQRVLDSLSLRLFYSNQLIVTRDSTYIVDRYNELNK